MRGSATCKHTLAAQHSVIHTNSTLLCPGSIPRHSSAGLRWRPHHGREGGKSKSKMCRSRAFSAIISFTRPMRMTQRQWRRSDRAFRSRDLDFHRTLTGRLREHRRGDFEGTVGGYNVDRAASRASHLSYASILCTLGRGAGRRRL